MSQSATYAQLWARVQRRAPLMLGPLMLLAVVAGVLQQRRQAQQAREVMAFYQEETRRLYSELDLCRQPPPPRSLAVRTHEGATHEDVGGTRGSSHWLGTIHLPQQPPRHNEPPEGDGEARTKP